MSRYFSVLEFLPQYFHFNSGINQYSIRRFDACEQNHYKKKPTFCCIKFGLRTGVSQTILYSINFLKFINFKLKNDEKGIFFSGVMHINNRPIDHEKKETWDYTLFHCVFSRNSFFSIETITSMWKSCVK